jgi:hypothetical protein
MTSSTRTRTASTGLSERATTAFDECLADVLDPFTRDRLTQAGVADSTDCLLIGADTEPIAQWLLAYVGPHGHIAHINPVGDLPHGLFGLIYCRMALSQTPDPRGALSDLVDRLTPGGLLVVDEWVWSGSVLASPDPRAPVLFEWYQYALAAALSDREDANWAESVPTALLDLGLVDVDVATCSRSWPSGSPGARLHIALITELHDQLLAADLSPDGLDDLRTALATPGFLLLGNTAISTFGRRPWDTGAPRRGEASR